VAGDDATFRVDGDDERTQAKSTSSITSGGGETIHNGNYDSCACSYISYADWEDTTDTFLKAIGLIPEGGTVILDDIDEEDGYTRDDDRHGRRRKSRSRGRSSGRSRTYERKRGVSRGGRSEARSRKSRGNGARARGASSSYKWTPVSTCFDGNTEVSSMHTKSVYLEDMSALLSADDNSTILTLENEDGNTVFTAISKIVKPEVTIDDMASPPPTMRDLREHIVIMSEPEDEEVKKEKEEKTEEADKAKPAEAKPQHVGIYELPKSEEKKKKIISRAKKMGIKPLFAKLSRPTAMMSKMAKGFRINKTAGNAAPDDADSCDSPTGVDEELMKQTQKSASDSHGEESGSSVSKKTSRPRMRVKRRYILTSNGCVEVREERRPASPSEPSDGSNSDAGTVLQLNVEKDTDTVKTGVTKGARNNKTIIRRQSSGSTVFKHTGLDEKANGTETFWTDPAKKSAAAAGKILSGFELSLQEFIQRKADDMDMPVQVPSFSSPKQSPAATSKKEPVHTPRSPSPMVDIIKKDFAEQTAQQEKAKKQVQQRQLESQQQQQQQEQQEEQPEEHKEEQAEETRAAMPSEELTTSPSFASMCQTWLPKVPTLSSSDVGLELPLTEYMSSLKFSGMLQSHQHYDMASQFVDNACQNSLYKAIQDSPEENGSSNLTAMDMATNAMNMAATAGPALFQRSFPADKASVIRSPRGDGRQVPSRPKPAAAEAGKNARKSKKSTAEKKRRKARAAKAAKDMTVMLHYDPRNARLDENPIVEKPSEKLAKSPKKNRARRLLRSPLRKGKRKQEDAKPPKNNDILGGLQIIMT